MSVPFLSTSGKSAPRGLAGLVKAGSVNAFRALAPLPKNTQELVDQAVVRVGRQRLTLIDDLIREGLVYRLPNWLSVPSLYWERLGEAGTARTTMVPNAKGERQVMDRSGRTLPIPCTWDDFSFNIRELSAAERVGSPLDTTHIEQATRNVNEKLEDIGWNGGPQIAGNSIYGVLNAPNYNVGVITEAKWTTNASDSGTTMVAETLTMIGQLQSDKKYGPYYMYVGTAISNQMQNDFSTLKGDGTIMDRLLKIDSLKAIRTADMLPANTVVLIQMTSDVIDLVWGQTPTVVSWETGPGWEREFVVLACMVPRVRDDYSGNSGIVVGT